MTFASSKESEPIARPWPPKITILFPRRPKLRKEDGSLAFIRQRQTLDQLIENEVAP